MVSRRRYTTIRRLKPAIALVLSLCALAAASGAYLGSSRPAARSTDKAVLSGIAPIYRQISGQAGQAVPVSSDGSSQAKYAPFEAAFLRLDEYAEELEATAAEETDLAALNLSPSGVAVSRIGGPWPPRGAVRGLSMPEDLKGAAALVLNNSFSSLFSKIFDPQADESGRNAELSAEARNPFSEAKQKENAASLAATDTAQGSENQAVTDAKPAESAPSGPDAAAASGSVARPERYVFLGDFDASGALSMLTAERSGDLVFKFADGSRAFSLFVNAAAVESQRSLSLDDINGDGLIDLLVTARANLFGGVLLGDGKGGYSLGGTFLTGYEPVLAAVGPAVEGGREIVTVNTRSGVVTRFLPRSTYQRQSAGKLDFLPEYLNHVVDPERGTDYLEIARSGGEARLYEWPVSGRMELRNPALPPPSRLEAGPDPNFGSKVGSIRIHQIGAHASVVLEDASGRSFNVANLKVTPQVCLVLGDLENRGNLDVAVAHLVSFVPSK